MVPLQRQPDSTSPKTTWQYLSKDNLTVPLQRQPDSTSLKTTWQYLFEDNLTAPLQRRPDSTSPKTTWQYLFKDNLTVPLQRQLGLKQTQQQRQKANLSSLLILRTLLILPLRWYSCMRVNASIRLLPPFVLWPGLLDVSLILWSRRQQNDTTGMRQLELPRESKQKQQHAGHTVYIWTGGTNV